MPKHVHTIVGSLLVLSVFAFPAGLQAAEPVPLPGYEQNSGRAVVLPAARSPLLPTGQANLTYEWIENGGARLYWNTLLLPRQLRMGGARFVDPALTPQLLLEEKPKPRRPRSRHKAPAAVANKASVTEKAPPQAGSTALRPPKQTEARPPQNQPAIPPASTQPPKGTDTPPRPAATAPAVAPARPVSAAPIPIPAASNRASLPMPRNPVSPLQ